MPSAWRVTLEDSLVVVLEEAVAVWNQASGAFHDDRHESIPASVSASDSAATKSPQHGAIGL